MQKSIRLVIRQESDGPGAGEQSVTSTNSGMIYKPRADLHSAHHELHFGEFLNVDFGRKFAHRDREKRRLHRLGHNFAKVHIKAVVAADIDFIFLVVRWAKKGQSLDMVPMSMRDQQCELDR